MSKKPKKEFNKLTPLCSAADNMTLLIEDLIEKLRTIVARENMGEGLDAKYIKELVAAMKDLTFPNYRKRPIKGIFKKKAAREKRSHY